jgi:uncharacterized protein (TIGR02217 family)
MKSCRPQDAPAATDQVIGTGDGSTLRFALVKTYGEGEDAYARAITRPVAGSVVVAVGGVEKSTPRDFFIDAVSGEIVFEAGAAPADGATVTAGFEFDVPVRFDAESLQISLTAFNAGQIPAVPLVEVLE